MNKKRSFMKRFIRNIGSYFKRIPRRIGHVSSRLDTSFGKAMFGNEDSSGNKPSHVVTTVVVSLVISYGASRFFGGAFAQHVPGLKSDGLLTSGWGGMLFVLLLLSGFNCAALLLLIDRQYQEASGTPATHRIAQAIMEWGEGESQTQAKPDAQDL